MIPILILIALVVYGLVIMDRIALDQLRKEWDEWNG